MTDAGVTIREFSRDDAIRVLPRRSFGAHKWGVGGLLIIAGSPGYVGAAALCAMAAGRAGAGIVNLAVHRSLVSSITSIVPEAGYSILPEGDLSSRGKRVLDTLEQKAEKCHAFVVGPGLGDDEYALGLVTTLLGQTERASLASLGFGVPRPQPADATGQHSLIAYDRPILFDADGLNALAKIDDWWSRVPEHRLVLTPHVGEFGRLMEMSPEDILANPERAAVTAANRFRQVVLLKGAPTIVTDGRVVFRAADSPPSLATGGSGDVLSGMIGAFLAQGLSLLDAANLGVHVGARAARRMEPELGTLGLVASDLPRAIAIELAALEQE
jgi:ADP-dependent NAD(P)H-hydrate dehydratase / NAD(P)H-hydrate epimerase